MNDRSPDPQGKAAEPRFARRPRGRHAGPRTSALTRLPLPVGKALMLTALPTALVLGTLRLPEFTDTSVTVAHSASAEDPGEPGTSGVDCAHPGNTSGSASAASPSPTPSTEPSTSSAHPGDEPVKPPEHADGEGASPTPDPTIPPSPSETSAPTGLGDLLTPLGLLHDDTEQKRPSPQASPSADPADPTPAAPQHADGEGASPTPAPTRHQTAESSAEPKSLPQETSRYCDISDFEAPQDKPAGRFSADAWNMKGSRLDLHDVVFHGVVTVDTAAGRKRVLKFTAAAVSIRDLKMAVPVGPQIQHIDGAPGSTSTVRGDDTITMYVESLTGTVSGVETIPTPPLLRLHLTPDTVPEWLYNTIGKPEVKFQLSLNDADIDQAGQTGGRLVIPGIHGYGTPR